MENSEFYRHKLLSTDPGVGNEALITVIPYNLSDNGENIECDGLLALFHNRITVYLDGERQISYDTSGVTEIKSVSGIGCVSLELILGTDETRLCRADMTHLHLYAGFARQFNVCLDHPNHTFDIEDSFLTTCPKCNSPYPPGSKICPGCADKTKYLGRLFKVAAPYWGYLALSVGLYFLIAGLNLLVPVLNRVLVDDYIKAETIPVIWQFLSVIGMIFAVNLLVQFISVGRNLALIEAGTKIIVRLREMIFNKIQMISLARVSKRTAGELMNRVSSDTDTLKRFITQDMGNFLQQIVIFTVVSAYIFAYDWKLALMIVLPAPMVILSNRLMWRYLGKRYHKQWTTNSRANSVLHDIFSGIRVVKAFGTEKYETERYDKVIRDERDISQYNERIYAIIAPLTSFLMGVGEFVLLYYVGNKILNREMTLGEMQQFSAYVTIIYQPLRWMAHLPRMLVQAMTSVVKIFDIIDEEPDVADRENALESEINGDISIRDISFGYEESSNVLKHVSLEIKQGEMIGIVGRSGVGKSTLINLIMRLYDVDDGQILIDGNDIRDISQNSLRSQIGVVLQETYLFAGTIYDNIAYAKPDASRDEVIIAAKAAGAHTFIMKLPDAYNTKVGEKGYTLSGGERQRVAIARALLHNPRILILDEATGSLDTETEKQIQDAFKRLTAERTTIAIAHRLSTLRNATRLVVLDRGTVAESGTHEELMQQKGIYYGLVMAQRQTSKLTKNN